MSERGRYTRGAVGLVLSGILLAWVIWKLDPARLLEVMGSVSLQWLALAVAVKLGVILIKVQRWTLVLRDTLGVPPKRVGRAVFLGFFGNAVLPMKLGELARIQLCRRHNDLGFSQTVGTMVVERTLDAITVLGLFAAVALVFPLPEWASRGALPVAAATVVLVVGLVWMAVRGFQLPAALFPGPLQAVRGKVNGMVAGFSTGLSVVKSPGLLAALAAVTVLIWCTEATGTWLALRAFGVTPGWDAALVVTVIVTLGAAVPSAPAGVGTHQFLYVVLLGQWGVTAEVATGVSLTVMIAMISALTVIGMSILWLEGLSLSALRAASPESALPTESHPNEA